MRFCPKCGTLMRPRVINGKKVLVCPKCGYTLELDPGVKDKSYKITKRLEHSPKEKTIVIKEEIETLPKLKDVVYCPKCGYNIVYYWMAQTRSADEPPTRFYKCARCGYVWREYE